MKKKVDKKLKTEQLSSADNFEVVEKSTKFNVLWISKECEEAFRHQQSYPQGKTFHETEWFMPIINTQKLENGVGIKHVLHPSPCSAIVPEQKVTGATVDHDEVDLVPYIPEDASIEEAQEIAKEWTPYNVWVHTHPAGTTPSGKDVHHLASQFEPGSDYDNYVMLIIGSNGEMSAWLAYVVKGTEFMEKPILIIDKMKVWVENPYSESNKTFASLFEGKVHEPKPEPKPNVKPNKLKSVATGYGCKGKKETQSDWYRRTYGVGYDDVEY